MNEPERILRERLRKIYSETTVEHIIHPHNHGGFPHPDGFGACRSSCGESMKIWLKVRDQIIQDAAFWTDGCAATIACGSMATDLIKDRTITQALILTARHIADALVDLPEGNLHCADLAAETVRTALKDCLSIQQQPWKKLYRK